MKRKGSGRRRGDWLGESVEKATPGQDAVMLDLVHRSAQQAYRKTRDRDVAEDVAVDAVMPLLREIESDPALLEKPRTLRSRVYHLTVGYLRNWKRGEKRAAVRHEKLARDMEIRGVTISDPWQTPDDPRLDQLKRILPVLSAEEFEAYLHLCVYGLTSEQAQEWTGVKAATLRQRWRRGLAKLEAAAAKEAASLDRPMMETLT